MIVGAGIVGVNISYLLQKRNINHIIVDKNKTLLNNASGAAGAFVSPIYNTKSPIGTMLQTAFSFASKFYEDFPNCVDKGIVHLGANETEPPAYDTPFEKVLLYGRAGYLLQDALVIDPVQLVAELNKNAPIVLDEKVTSLEYVGDGWCVNEKIWCEKVIMTSGYETELIEEEYIDLRGVSGVKIKIHSNSPMLHNGQEDIFFSKSHHGEITIGATHHRTALNEKIIEKDTQALIAKWQQITGNRDAALVEQKTGIRACSKDYFPIVGQIIDAQKTLALHPSIYHGTKISNDKVVHKNNLHICSGVGGKGYTWAPYLAHILVNNLFSHQKIPSALNTYSRFLRYYRKNKLVLVKRESNCVT